MQTDAYLTRHGNVAAALLQCFLWNFEVILPILNEYFCNHKTNSFAQAAVNVARTAHATHLLSNGCYTAAATNHLLETIFTTDNRFLQATKQVRIIVTSMQHTITHSKTSEQFFYS